MLSDDYLNEVSPDESNVVLAKLTFASSNLDSSGIRLWTQRSVDMPTSILRYGNQGIEVMRLQKLLNETLHPIPPLRMDGEFGPRTEAAVRNYQASIGMEADGMVGVHTWFALERRHSRHTRRIFCDGAISSVGAKWLAVAMQEIGQKEIRGSEDNPRILEYHSTTYLDDYKDETPWCSSFVNWCLLQVGIVGTNKAAAASWLTWGKSCAPRLGAIAVIHNSKAAGGGLTASGYHVGFLLDETATHYCILGGNHHDQVKKSTFAKAAWGPARCRWPSP